MIADRPQIRVNISEQRVWQDGRPVKVKNKVFTLLTLFLANQGRLLTRRAILRHVWPDTHVSETSVKDCVKNLRAVLNDDVASPAFIETIRGQGYRYLGGIEVHDDWPEEAAGETQLAGAKRSGDNPFDIDHFKRTSIVIMPFRELGEPSSAWLAQGLRLTLHSVLIKLSGFFLLHSGVVEPYRSRHYSAAGVGSQLGVQYVVEGTVQRSGHQIRVIVELIDTSNGRIVWGETYDWMIDGTFEFQDDVARKIVGALDIRLRSGELGRLLFETTSNGSAREYLLRGISHLHKGDRENNLLARKILTHADRLEPDLAPCLGMIAMTHWRDSRFGWSADPVASLDSAADYARRTLNLGDPEGMGHAIMGYVQLQKRRHDAAISLSLEAFSRRPGCPLANGLLAEVLRFCGSPDKSITRMKETMRLVKILPPWMIGNLAASLRDNNQVRASIAIAREAVRHFPDDLDLLATLCCDYEEASMIDEAAVAARRILSVDPSFSTAQYIKSQPYKNIAILDNITKNLTRAGLPE